MGGSRAFELSIGVALQLLWNSDGLTWPFVTPFWRHAQILYAKHVQKQKINVKLKLKVRAKSRR